MCRLRDFGELSRKSSLSYSFLQDARICADERGRKILRARGGGYHQGNGIFSDTTGLIQYELTDNMAACIKPAQNQTPHPTWRQQSGHKILPPQTKSYLQLYLLGEGSQLSSMAYEYKEMSTKSHSHLQQEAICHW